MISIDQELKQICPTVCLGVLMYNGEVTESSPALIKIFDQKVRQLKEQYRIEDIPLLPHVKSTRALYRALGKAPSSYRNSAEAMLRRVVNGKGLYHINNIIEVNNLISISSGYSIGSYTMENIIGEVGFEIAKEGAHYEGIGKDSVNIARLPVLYDEMGYFGNPTGDSQRTLVQLGQQKILTVLYSFDGRDDLVSWMDQYQQYLSQYCGIQEVRKQIIT